MSITFRRFVRKMWDTWTLLSGIPVMNGVLNGTPQESNRTLKSSLP
jgi:hypothetical protein